MCFFFVPDMSTFQQTTLSAEAYLEDGHIFLDEQTLHTAKSAMYRAGSQRPAVSTTQGQNLE
jgi:hypothetical protein